MPKIKMLKTAKGCDNGIDVFEYKEGETYSVSENLLKSFSKMNVCKVEKERPIKTPVLSNKIKPPVKENKSA